jgi:hypothetical protein
MIHLLYAFVDMVSTHNNQMLEINNTLQAKDTKLLKRTMRRTHNNTTRHMCWMHYQTLFTNLAQDPPTRRPVMNKGYRTFVVMQTETLEHPWAMFSGATQWATTNTAHEEQRFWLSI